MICLVIVILTGGGLPSMQGGSNFGGRDRAEFADIPTRSRWRRNGRGRGAGLERVFRYQPVSECRCPQCG
jgi:hypothetical protein